MNTKQARLLGDTGPRRLLHSFLPVFLLPLSITKTFNNFIMMIGNETYRVSRQQWWTVTLSHT